MEITINHLSPAAAILISIILIAYKFWKNEEIILSNMVSAIIAGGMLPLAVGFILHPFYPEFLGSIEERSLQITLTGLVLVFVYMKTIFKQVKSNSS